MSLKGRSCWVVNIRMDESEKLSLESMSRFVAAIEEIRFEAEDREQLYAWVEQVLVGQQYAQLGKAARGLVRRYIEKMTGLSRAQGTRLIARYTASGRVQVTVYRRRRFSERYTRADIELLASVDEAHETLSGPATRRILERAHRVYKQPEFARLASISVAHLYNLRHHQRYRERLLNYTKTRPTAVSIGERRKPQPQGQPGFLRLDTVHQGDQPEGGEKGVYHINAVDEITQWEVVGSTPRISEAYLEPLLEAMMRQFPFRILGFHTDNGSEFINRMVARLLEKLRIEQTKSRPRQSGDNGLVETKNGAIIRKHIGYGYIDPSHADQINSFYREHLNPYLNYHRPCAQADVKIDEKGRKRVSYTRYQTPLETLSLLDKPAQYLRDGLSMSALNRVAAAINDTDAARRMQQAKSKLFEKLQLTA
jgi:transposase InsO family protein